MSDSNQFGSAGTAVAEPPADETLAGSKGPKPLVLVAVVVGVLAVAAAAYFLLFSGGSDDQSASGAVPKGNVSAPAGSQAPSASAKPVTSTPPKTVVGSGGRDPFAPLVVAAASGSATSGSGSGSGTGTGTGTATVPSGLTENVTLNKVATSPATVDVTINGKKYTAQTAGQVFGKYFSLALVTGTNTATINFGDTSVDLIVGKPKVLHT